MRKKFVLIYVVFSLLIVPRVEIAQVKVAHRNIDEIMPHAMEAWKVPGLALAIVKDGRVVYAKGFGYGDIEKKLPVDENTIFGCGSTSKAFTAALVATLVTEGKLNWDDKVIDHLPEFQMYDPYVTREITVRDLLCHRSGLPEADFVWLSSSFTRDDIVHKIRFIKPSSGFRSQFIYHNLMITVAGQLVARVTGKSWDENIKERIFGPLGMTRSSTSIRDFRAGDGIATPYVLSEGKLTAIPWLNIDNIGPAGSVNSTALDYAKWIQLHLGKGTFQGKTLWSAEAQKAMNSPQSIMTATTSGLTHFYLYGLCWMLNDYRGKLAVWHSGATDGMGAIVGMLPEENLGVAVLCNTFYPTLLTNLMYRIFDMYLGFPERDWKKLEPLPPAPAPLQKTEFLPPQNTKPSLSLNRYVGTYTSPLYGNARVVLKQGQLALDFDSYPSASLQHKYLDTFRASFGPDIPYMAKLFVGQGVDVTFTIDARAMISEMTIDIFGAFERRND
jgi:CubicO group peptidase (beta-lactamase class C family)